MKRGGVENFDISKLKCMIFPGKNPSSHLKEYQSAYQLWKDVWGNFWQVQAGKEVAVSDTFLKQDHILTTFYGDQCIAMMLLNYFDFRNESSRYDTYFQKVWLPEKHELIKGHRVLAASHYTVHPDFRRDQFVYSMKEWIGSLTIQYFLNTDCQIMVGAMRKNKGVDKTAKNVGSTLIQTYKQDEMNLDLDLVIFERDKVHLHDSIALPIKSHWNGRIEVEKETWRKTDEGTNETKRNRKAA